MAIFGHRGAVWRWPLRWPTRMATADFEAWTVLPNYTAMRQTDGTEIKSRALRAIEPTVPLENTASQHEVAKHYVQQGGGGWFGAGGGPGYGKDGLSYPTKDDGTPLHKTTLPFKYDKQPIPSFSGWAVDFMLFRIKWSQLECQFRGDGSEWSLAELLKKNCHGHAKIVLEPFAPVPYYYDSMWKALLKAFGPSSKILEDLLNQVKALGKEHVELREPKKYLSWLNRIERVRNNIIRVSSDWQYSVTPDMVRALANKLPHNLQRDWFIISDEISRLEAEVTLFSEFVRFLEVERSFVESQVNLGVRIDPDFAPRKDDKKKDKQDSHHGDSYPNNQKTQTHPRHPNENGKRSPSPSPTRPQNHKNQGDGAKNKLRGKVCFYCDKSNPPHLLKTCQAWKSLSKKDRRAHIVTMKFCVICLKPKNGHKDAECENVSKIPRVLCSSDDCKHKSKRHSSWLSCNATTVASNHTSLSRTTIFPINLIKLAGTELYLNAFHDEGSSSSFIMKSVAKKRHLKRVGKIDLTVNTMGGGSMDLVSWTYEVPIEMKNHETHILYAQSVDNFLIKKLKFLDLDFLRSEFPNYEGTWENLQYQSLTAELLIGLSDLKLIPRTVLHEGLNEANLQIRTGMLGDTVMGSYNSHNPCPESNSVSIQIGTDCYHSDDISISPHTREVSINNGFPTEALRMPRILKCEPIVQHETCCNNLEVTPLESSANQYNEKRSHWCKSVLPSVCLGCGSQTKSLSSVDVHAKCSTLTPLKEPVKPCGGSQVGVFTANLLTKQVLREIETNRLHFAEFIQVHEFKSSDPPSSCITKTYMKNLELEKEKLLYSNSKAVGDALRANTQDKLKPKACINKHGRTSKPTTINQTYATKASLTPEVNDSANLNLISKRETKSFKDSVDKFLAGENLATAITPLCGSCKCGKCPIPGHTYSFREEQELQLIRSGLHFDSAKNMWVADYPWISPPTILPDNKWQAVKILESVERKLTKNPEWIEKYQEQIDDLLDRKAARKLSQEELDSHVGPFFYVTHLIVVNPKSTSTPVRMVFNSSLKCQNGLSLNDCLAKGPDAYMNKLLGVLLRWREYKSAFIGDISKMFHAVGISQADMHMHRFLWRDMRTNDPPDTYVAQVVTFGDKPAGTLAEEAMYQQARSMLNTHPLAAEAILRSTYVDDIDHSLDSTGDTCLSLVKSVAEVLSKGGFNVKEWWLSGEGRGRKNKDLDIPYGNLPQVVETASKLKSSDEGFVSVLGVLWDPVSDKLRFQCPFNFHSKKEIVKGAPTLQLSEFEQQFPSVLTRRLSLRQVARIFDPIGIVSPFILQAKLLLRATLQETGDEWDKPLSPDLYCKWRDWFKSAFEIDGVVAPRCLKPLDAVGSPSLIILSDGSEEAYGFTAYVRWRIGKDQFASNLIAAKCRIAPINRISIPQMELNGALLATRARINLISEMSYQFEQIIHMVDSTTVLCQINSLSSRFKVYEGVRIGEIQASGLIESWLWVEGSLNVSDDVTRGKSPRQLLEDNNWLHGPDFLKNDQSDWPTMSYQQVVALRHSPPLFLV